MCWSDCWSLYRHFQPVPCPNSRAHMPQIHVSIAPVAKQPTPMCLMDYCPVVLTPIRTKYLEPLVLAHLKDNLPPTLDPYQFAYRKNRSIEDVVSTALDTVLTHLDNSNTYPRILFVDFSSVFNTDIPSRFATKLRDLGINTPHLQVDSRLFDQQTTAC